LETKRAGSQIAKSSVDYERLLAIGYDLLVAIGEDPNREGIRETPRRWASWWREFIEYDAGNIDVTFESVTTDQLVVVSGLRVWSLCEHHLLPFWSDITVGYLAEDRVMGLSKIARITTKVAHRLQLQERLVHQIADEIQAIIGSDKSVAVLGQGEHLCMAMRGVKMRGLMTTSVMRGFFMEKPELRQEFLQLAIGERTSHYAI